MKHPKYDPWPASEEINAKANGSLEGSMHLGVGVWMCGDISDGVSMRMKDGFGWVISFASLESWYLANKELRDHASAKPDT